VILVWNMIRLAEALLPLLDDEGDKAVEIIQPRLAEIPDRVDAAWRSMMATKIGLARADDPYDASLVTDLQALMQQHALDYTNTFAALDGALDTASTDGASATALPLVLDPWLARWRSRLDEVGSRANAASLMQRANPRVSPRNHHVEAALSAVVESGDTGPAERLIEALRDPYTAGPQIAAYIDPPPEGDQDYRTFCGT
jgi:uncharacterized protein YdiU (UPF0061 family)